MPKVEAQPTLSAPMAAGQEAKRRAVKKALAWVTALLAATSLLAATVVFA